MATMVHSNKDVLYQLSFFNFALEYVTRNVQGNQRWIGLTQDTPAYGQCY